MSTEPKDDVMIYAVSALAIGGTLGAIGLAMHLLSKADARKQTPFYKDENPTREFRPPSLD
jgi:hypothetical protein